MMQAGHIWKSFCQLLVFQCIFDLVPMLWSQDESGSYPFYIWIICCISVVSYMVWLLSFWDESRSYIKKNLICLCYFSEFLTLFHCYGHMGISFSQLGFPPNVHFSVSDCYLLKYPFNILEMAINPVVCRMTKTQLTGVLAILSEIGLKSKKRINEK